MERYDELLTGSWDIVTAIRYLAQRITDLETQLAALQNTGSGSVPEPEPAPSPTRPSRPPRSKQP